MFPYIKILPWHLLMEKVDIIKHSLQNKSACACVVRVCVFPTKSQKQRLYYLVHRDSKPGWMAGCMDG